MPVYPVTILEDPKTRETVFLNAEDQEIFAPPAATGYDPYVYLKSINPGL